MKKIALFAVALGAMAMTSCKSKEDMYRKMYEDAQANMVTEQTATTQTNTVVVPPAETTPTVVVPVETETVTQTQTTTQTTVTPVDLSGTRQIQGGVTVVSGEQLKEFSVVVGSFQTQANAEGLKMLLQSKGYASRVIKTNETINGQTGWFRVIAASFSDKASAAQLRDQMIGDYPGAWLLYNK
jgi:cell division protein FtsN